jgi:DNA polymerase III beta subunit
MFSIKKDELVSALNITNSVIADKSATIPLLCNVLIRAIDKSIHISASDSVTSVLVRRKCEESTSCTICIPSKELYDRVKKMPANSLVTIDENGRIICNKSNVRHKLPILDPQLFPKIIFDKSKNPSPSIVIDSVVLDSLISKIWFSVDNDSSRPSTNNAYLFFNGETVKIIAFDGYRLISMEQLSDCKHSSIFIPYKSVMFIRRWLAKEKSGKISIFKEQSGYCHMKLNDTIYSFLTMNVDVPDFDKIFSINYKNYATFKKDELIESVTSVTLSDDKIKFEFDKSKSNCKILSSDGAGKSTEDTVDCNIHGNTIDFKINSKFMLEPLSNFSSDDIRIELGSSPEDPIMLVEDKYKIIIAPMSC